jgi:sec-independent protein translocase protein TatA
MNLGGWEILIILGVLVLLFGAKRLPDMARSIGQSARVLKGEMKGLKEDKPADPPQPQAEKQALPPSTPPSATAQNGQQQSAPSARPGQDNSGQ